jgi:3'-phosphoadenosine 5'-phosphosulfate sulfotransferase (PAPS reductase)/FAD synthetase
VVFVFTLIERFCHESRDALVFQPSRAGCCSIEEKIVSRKGLAWIGAGRRAESRQRAKQPPRQEQNCFGRVVMREASFVV